MRRIFKQKRRRKLLGGKIYGGLPYVTRGAGNLYRIAEIYDPETGSYVCDEVIEAIAYNFSGDDSQIIYCYNNVVNIIDGKISSIEASYYFDEKDDDMDYSFKYYNIGITVMEIPQSVIDNAIAEQE